MHSKEAMTAARNWIDSRVGQEYRLSRHDAESLAEEFDKANAQVSKNAKRYRYLRDQCTMEHDKILFDMAGDPLAPKEEIDSAIDSAMTAASFD